ncbi:tRNA pseudouridine(55) synthase TruB [Muriicola marianensis]|uniref:tRNA pseudouridine synthase B n=1 Tax=Muriicola marianensis TaxID=1324801 RepID=A0ABQ1QZ34_9FLAO|nr:tRNA pseudouridine(55) synthase TruB [Muriicola marianensis]GGD52460.1 tRNA pseudouridine synthase B [Muriicola marianensis]
MNWGSLSKEDYLNGQVILFDKPLGWSSFQVVNSAKWALRKKFDLKKIKVGHAGTLDPLATGLLVVCTGKFTKNIPGIQDQKKEYMGTITLGATTPSYDLETEVDQRFSTDHLTKDQVLQATKSFTGKIYQKPPVFSAIKKEGKRLYEYARKGKEVEVNAREIEIYEFEITSVEMPEVHFRVVCGKGTYIRSLAHDFGQKLNSGGHLSALRRTKIGSFSVDNAITPEVFKKLIIAE